MSLAGLNIPLHLTSVAQKVFACFVGSLRVLTAIVKLVKGLLLCTIYNWQLVRNQLYISGPGLKRDTFTFNHWV